MVTSPAAQSDMNIGASSSVQTLRKRYVRATTALFLGTLLLSVAGGVFQLLAIPSEERGPRGNYHDPEGAITWGVLMLCAAIIGVLIARKQPQNAIGLVFSAGAFAGAVSLAGDQLAAYGLITAPGSLPGGTFGYYLSYVGLYMSWAALGVLVPLMFPDGSLDNSFRKIVAWSGVLSSVFWSLSIFHPALFDSREYYADLPSVDNPLGVEALQRVIEIISAIGLFGLFGSMFLAIASLLPRAIRARGMQRQQMKIVAYTTAVTTVVLLVGANLRNVPAVRESPALTIIDFALSAAIVAIPAAFAVAILKYRLYDVDFIINRTLVYASLSAVLVAIYIGGVLLFTMAFDPITGDTDIGVAASTLVVATLFHPLRRRIQAFIDRRFYRSRYDAQQVLERFSARLRGHLALEGLTQELLDAVEVTVRPRNASLWLEPRALGRESPPNDAFPISPHRFSSSGQ